MEENHKLLEHLSTFDPKTIMDTVINAIQSDIQANKSHNFGPKPYKPSQFYGKPKELQLVPGTDFRTGYGLQLLQRLRPPKIQLPQIKSKGGKNGWSTKLPKV